MYLSRQSKTGKAVRIATEDNTIGKNLVTNVAKYDACGNTKRRQ